MLRNLRPLDAESVAQSTQRVDACLAQHLSRAEAATRAMMAMWSVALHLENESFSILPPEKRDEPADVPPIESSVRL